MRDPIILRRDDLLHPPEANYWKDLLYRVTKIGTEIEVAPPKGVRRPDFQAAIAADLQPSESLAHLGPNGVLNVEAEHCGLEIRLIGRQPHFLALQKQYTSITNRLKQHQARVRPTCGMHFHLLTPGLAEPVPEIILANFWNLTRRYAPELKFITSAGDKREALCRRRNHNSHLEMIKHSPATMSMTQIQNCLQESQIVPEHQNFLNLEHIKITETGDVLPFHLEYRFPDADISPTSLTAKTFLFLAMLIKAVDLSQYGVIHVGTIQTWRRKVELLDMLSNNDGLLATSDTSQVTEPVIEELRQGCYECLDLLAPSFSRFIDNPSLEVLYALAEHPISLMRCAGYNWDDIEAHLIHHAALDELGIDKLDRRLMQSIELGEWANLESLTSWQWKVAHELYLTPQELERRLARLHALRGLRWDARQGTIVFTS